MKKILMVLLCGAMLAGCSRNGQSDIIVQTETTTAATEETLGEKENLTEETEQLTDSEKKITQENPYLGIEDQMKELYSDIESINSLEDLQDTDPVFTYSGSEEDVISGVTTDAISYAHIVFNGDAYFSVRGLYDDTSDLLVSAAEPYDGITLLFPNKEYTFDVTLIGQGDWTIEVYRLGTSSTDTFSGKGDFVTPIFKKTSNLYEVTVTSEKTIEEYSEESTYLRGWTDSGYELLVCTRPNGEFELLFDSGEEYAFFEIKSEDEWEIKPVGPRFY